MTDLSTPPQPVKPPRLSRNEAQARTALAQRAHALPLRLGETPWLADLTPLAHAPDVAESCCTLAVEWAGATLCMRLPAAAVGELTAPLLGEASLPDLPPELAQAVLQAALADVFAALRALGRGEPNLVGFALDGVLPAACSHAMRLLLRQTDGTAALQASLHTDGLGLLLLAGLLAKRAPVASSDGADGVLALPAEIGCTRLAADELAALAPGDVVLIATSHIAAQRVLWLTANGRAGMQVQLPAPDAPVEPEGAARAPFLTVMQSWSPAMSTADPSADVAASLDTLPIRLSFDLGEVTLTLAEARALQPGQTIELARPLSGGVRIRANGALIGEGDLVEIDGQLGVSVRTLWANKA